VDGERRSRARCNRARGVADPVEPADRVQEGGERARGARDGEDPAADAHRRGDLEDAQHVEEPLGPAEIGDQKQRADRVRGGADIDAAPREPLVAGYPRHGAQDGRGAAEPAGEQVPGDLLLPDRLLEYRPPVVRAHLAHRDPPANAATTPATSAPAATAAVAHISGSFLVATTGSGGSP